MAWNTGAGEHFLASNPPSLLAQGMRSPVIDNGAAGNNATDDTTPISNAITAVPSAVGLGASEIICKAASFKLTATETIVGRSIIFRGSGIGNPADYATPGKGTTFSWQGAAGLPMFSVSASEYVIFEDIYFEGNGTNVPSDLVFFDGTSSAHDGNHRFIFRRCLFGAFAWSNRTTLGVVCATNAVRFGGTNQNNDQFHFEDCWIRDTATGIALPNSQSIWGSLDGVTMDGMTVAGLDTSASVEGKNLKFNNCAIDIRVAGTAKVDIARINSENSHQIAALSSDGCRLALRGGVITQSANMGTNWIDHESCGNAGALILDGVTFTLAGFGHKKIKVRGLAAGAGLIGEVDIRGCGAAIALADLDIANVVSGDDLWVTVDSGAIFLKQKLRGGGFHDVLSTTAQTMQMQGALQRSTQTTTPVGAAVGYTPDATLGEAQEIIQGTTAQTLTIAAPANRLAGQFHTFKFVHFNDAVAWTLTFNAVFKRAGGAFANTNTANAVDTITFYDDGVNLREVGRAVNLS